MKYLLLLIPSLCLLILSCDNKAQQRNEEIKRQVTEFWKHGLAEPQVQPDSVTILSVDTLTEKSLMSNYIELLEDDMNKSRDDAQQLALENEALYEQAKASREDSLAVAMIMKTEEQGRRTVAFEIQLVDSIKQVYAKANDADFFGYKVQANIYTTEKGKHITNNETIFISRDHYLHFLDIYALLSQHRLPPFKMN